MASTTDKFLKSRAAKTAPVKPGQWHADFSTVKKYAVGNKIPLLAVWSNGDACGNCTHLEKVCMEKKFTSWAKTSGVAMWFGCSSDKSAADKFEGAGFKFARNGKLTGYPFVRLYWPDGGVDVWKSGSDWTGGLKEGTIAKSADKFVKNLSAALKNYDPGKKDDPTPEPTPEPTPSVDEYKVRLNEKLTTAQVNKILDAIDKNDGYCPCQPKGDGTKCHCEDFVKNKGIGEPCICNIYVKQKK